MAHLGLEGGQSNSLVVQCPVADDTTRRDFVKRFLPARSAGDGSIMKTVRIGNGCGFWGDNLDAPVLLAQQGHLDFLTLEYLAELTMSILALQKQRDPSAGFATDFIDVLERLSPVLKKQPRLKIITNAGGMNPSACAIRAREILNKAGLADRKVATV